MIMNKIFIDSEDIVIKENGVYYLKPINSNYHIKIENNIECKIVIISENISYNIEYNLLENSSLIVNSLNYNTNTNIVINLDKHSKINYNHSVVCKEDSVNKFSLNHLSSDTISTINNNGINIGNNKLFFEIDGIITKKLNNVKCEQNSKIINYGLGNSKIIPNLLIESNDVIANHSAYIGNFDDDVKFYVLSRGIKLDMLIRMLYKAILLGTMDLTIEKEEFNKIINEWW